MYLAKPFLGAELFGAIEAATEGAIQGPLRSYEGFTALLPEATFFGVMPLGPDIEVGAQSFASTFIRAARYLMLEEISPVWEGPMSWLLGHHARPRRLT